MHRPGEMKMAKVIARAYCSSSGVTLLAYKWMPGEGQRFYGFSVRRTPGFHDPNSNTTTPFSWLPNRLNFAGPLDEDAPSTKAPIQKFIWWDARFHPATDANKSFTYDIIPVVGPSSQQLQLLDDQKATVEITFPERVQNKIGTWFNRPFVSSQAFSRLMQRYGVSANTPLAQLAPEQRDNILGWLANDLQEPIVDLTKQDGQIDGAIYHFNDTVWLEEAFRKRNKSETSIAVFWKNESKKKGDPQFFANAGFVKALGENVTFEKRKNIPGLMHDKILVLSSPSPEVVLMGSANFTTDGLTSQANVLHRWDYPDLAALYRQRVALLQKDVSKDGGGLKAQWSESIALEGGGSVRVFFPPEPGSSKSKANQGKTAASIKPIVAAIKSAKSSVVFCYFDSTDEEVRHACFDAGKHGLMMFGLVNVIGRNPPKDTPANKARIELYRYVRENRDIVGAASLSPLPAGWLKEISVFGGAGGGAKGKNKKGAPPEVHIHHKFILIDGETQHPVLYTGSANISANSSFSNDENLLEVRDCPHLAQTYLAEFFRLFEHYRFRFDRSRHDTAIRKGNMSSKDILRLDATGRKWFKKFFTKGTPEQKAMVRLV